jgi:hypothetical protein
LAFGTTRARQIVLVAPAFVGPFGVPWAKVLMLAPLPTCCN